MKHGRSSASSPTLSIRRCQLQCSARERFTNAGVSIIAMPWIYPFTQMAPKDKHCLISYRRTGFHILLSDRQFQVRRQVRIFTLAGHRTGIEGGEIWINLWGPLFRGKQLSFYSFSVGRIVDFSHHLDARQFIR
jgi:hypothetical protein